MAVVDKWDVCIQKIQNVLQSDTDKDFSMKLTALIQSKKDII